MNNIILYAVTVLIWGSTWYAISFQLGTVDPLASIAYRFGLSAILMLGALAFMGKFRPANYTRKQHAFIVLQGLFLFCLNYWLTYKSTIYLTTGLVAVIFSTLTLMNIFNQAIIFRIEIKKQVVLGSLIGLCGIAGVFWPEIRDMGENKGILTGILFGLGGTYLASLGNMAAIKNSRNNVPVLESNGYGMAYGAIACFLIIGGTGTPIGFEMTAGYIWSLLFLAVFGSVVAFWCYLTLMQNIGADKAAYASVMFPIVALVVSTIFEGYVWTPEALCGMVLVVLGNVVAMANREMMLHWRPRRAKIICGDE